MKNENLKHVQNIVVDLENYASGNYFLHNGELYPIDKDEFQLIAGCSIVDDDCYVLPDGEEVFENYIEPASLYDYFNDYLDVDYIVDCKKQYKAARILIAYGGPTIYIDTCDRQVQLYWWSDTATADIPMNICDEIDEFFEEIYNC